MGASDNNNMRGVAIYDQNNNFTQVHDHMRGSYYQQPTGFYVVNERNYDYNQQYQQYIPPL